MSDAIFAGLILVLFSDLCCSCKPLDQGPVGPGPQDKGPMGLAPREEAGSNPGEDWDVTYEFTGKVVHVGLLSQFNDHYVRIHRDPGFVVVVTGLRGIRGAPPADKGTIALGVHSLAKLFGSLLADDIVGKTYNFRVCRSRDGLTLWLDPRVVRPVRGGIKGHLDVHAGDFRK